MDSKFDNVACPSAMSELPPAKDVYTTQLEMVVGRIAKKTNPEIHTSGTISKNSNNKTIDNGPRKINPCTLNTFTQELSLGLK
jgi:hypothetical protein